MPRSLFKLNCSNKHIRINRFKCSQLINLQEVENGMVKMFINLHIPTLSTWPDLTMRSDIDTFTKIREECPSLLTNLVDGVKARVRHRPISPESDKEFVARRVDCRR